MALDALVRRRRSRRWWLRQRAVGKTLVRRSGAKRRAPSNQSEVRQFWIPFCRKQNSIFPLASSKMCAGQICVACAAGPMFTSLLCDNCTGFFMKRVCGECVTKATGCDILACALCTQLFCQNGGDSQWCAWHEAWHHVTCSTADCCGSDCESETDVFKVAWRDEIAGAESGSCDSDGESDHGPEDIDARLLSPAATIVEASVHERIERSDRAPNRLRIRSQSTLVRTDTGVTSDPA
jgi:hypothetical protein